MIEVLLAMDIMYQLPRPQAYVPNRVPGCYIVDENNRMTDLSLLCGGKKEVPRLTCADFESREAAQAAFDAGMPGTQGMDGDRDRVVCEWD